MEQVIVHCYLRVLTGELRHWVSHREPKRIDQVVKMVEHYTIIENLHGPVKSRELLPAQRVKPSTSLNSAFRRIWEWVPQCYSFLFWHEEVRRCCDGDAPAGGTHGVWVMQRMSFYTEKVYTTHLDLIEVCFKCDVWMNHLHARALLHSSSMVILIHMGMATKVGPIKRDS